MITMLIPHGSHQLLGRVNSLPFARALNCYFHLGHKVCSQPCPNYYILPFFLVPVDVLPLRVTPPPTHQTSLSSIFSKDNASTFFPLSCVIPFLLNHPIITQVAVIFTFEKNASSDFIYYLSHTLILPCPLDQSFSIEPFTLAVQFFP